MIQQKPRKVSNSYVVTIPREEVEQRGLKVGQLLAIEVRPVEVRPIPLMRPQMTAHYACANLPHQAAHSPSPSPKRGLSRTGISAPLSPRYGSSFRSAATISGVIPGKWPSASRRSRTEANSVAKKPCGTLSRGSARG